MIPRPTALASIQAVIFFGPGTQVQGSRVLRALPDAVINRFDGDPILAPLNQGPLQLNIPGFSPPSVILTRQDGSEQLQIGTVRADFVSLTGRFDGTLEEFFATGCRNLLHVRDALGARISRMAAVVHRYRAVPNPGRALAAQFCRDPMLQEGGPLNRPENFELHAHKVFRAAFGIQVNSWVRNRTGFVTATNTPVVAVEQDINTLENVENVDDATITRFFQGITVELDQVLRLYYPAEAAEP